MKHIHRFFVSRELKTGMPVRLEPDDAFHAAAVLRLVEGDPVELADASGRVFEAVISGTGGNGGKGREVEAVARRRLTSQFRSGKAEVISLVVVQALPRGRKMDLIVEKLSEIGVARLVPVVSEKSIPASGRSQGGKVARWRRVARAGSAQSKRAQIMSVDEPLRLDEWLGGDKGKLLVLATELAGKPLGQAMEEMRRASGRYAREITLVIGPEAGFSRSEVAMFKGRDADFVSLGPWVLRTETAALVAATVVMHRLGVIG
ncbi:MAG: 16S rRNA (uracil(1498)-N(3))-methyltransferase [Thermoleophilia bacterium]|nr:16S rRNA (uracil(1498)-N(3))-methyltransferase [Thermoleophilia bacterium]